MPRPEAPSEAPPPALAPPVAPAVAPTELAIRCSALRKVYPRNVEAVRRIDLEVRRGECFGLLGPNGAGKTTTIEILEGLLEPTSGDVSILGERWGRDDAALRQRLGITLQDTRLPERQSVLETLRLFRSFYERGQAPERVIELVDLAAERRVWVGKLSGGQRQRLAIACALVGAPELLFLDEPTTGLDPSSRRRIWELVRAFQQGGGTVLLTTHYMDEAERLCDRVAIIDRGEVIAVDTPARLIRGLGGDHVIEFAVARIASGGGGDDGGDGDDGSDDGHGAPRADTDLARAILPAMGGLRSVRSSRCEAAGAEGGSGTIVLTVGEPHLTLPGLLETLRERGLEITRLSTRHACLEDVFVHLTGRHMTDAADAAGPRAGGSDGAVDSPSPAA